MENIENGEQSEPILSKNQMKKLVKKKQKEEYWQNIKPMIRAKEKAKRKEKNKLKIIENQQNTQDYEKDGSFKEKFRDKYRNRMENAAYLIIDCQFQNQSNEKELKSLCQQLVYCHNINRSQDKPLKYTITSYGGYTKQVLDKQGAPNWNICIYENHYLDHFPKEKLVYLTGDSENEIEDIDWDKIYIIGGMVDHNRLKLASFNQAQEEGIQTARLPIQKYLQLKTSTILTIYLGLNVFVSNYFIYTIIYLKYLYYKMQQILCYFILITCVFTSKQKKLFLNLQQNFTIIVFEIMVLKYGGLSWLECLTKAIPKRKTVKIIDVHNIDNYDNKEIDNN